MEPTITITFFLTQIKSIDELTQDQSLKMSNTRGNRQHRGMGCSL